MKKLFIAIVLGAIFSTSAVAQEAAFDPVKAAEILATAKAEQERFAAVPQKESKIQYVKSNSPFCWSSNRVRFR